MVVGPDSDVSCLASYVTPCTESCPCHEGPRSLARSIVHVTARSAGASRSLGPCQRELDAGLAAARLGRGLEKRRSVAVALDRTPVQMGATGPERASARHPCWACCATRTVSG